ncbi:MAG: HD domain-containing protein [Sulfuricurvum sp.]|nr:HD domain-containing protein [Sulfuricurvum sp.]MDD5386534.1 HD domain-containing protein [Sulfuricurvum sp.]
MKKNITHLTLRRVLPLLLILMLCIIIVIGLNFRSLVLASMETRVLSITQIIKAGLTAHMKAGLMDKRTYFLHEIANTPNVKSVTIIRSDEVYKQFGKSLAGERRVDSLLRAILQSKKPYFTMSDWGEKATMRAVVPYIATSKDNLNCLQCHHVPENTVLGAVDIELDVTEYRNQALIYLLILFGIILFFTIAIIRNTSNVIEEFVRKPLLELIQLAKSIFYRTDTRDYTVFQSEEFTQVASQFMKFGEELKEREARIELSTIKFSSLNNEIDTALKETLFAMGEAEEMRSKETRNHTRRIVEYSRLLGKLVGLEEQEIDLLVIAAPLHDIGKIGIPDSILLKPGSLDDEERAIMHMHATMGHDILKHSERDVLQAAATIAYEHHERWDGLGYPRGLRREEIHIFGRIVAIADVFDALGTKRVYKEAWPLKQVKEYFEQESGKAFDPQIVNLLIQHYSQFEMLYNAHYDDQSALQA